MVLLPTMHVSRVRRRTTQSGAVSGVAAVPHLYMVLVEMMIRSTFSVTSPASTTSPTLCSGSAARCALLPRSRLSIRTQCRVLARTSTSLPRRAVAAGSPVVGLGRRPSLQSIAVHSELVAIRRLQLVCNECTFTQTNPRISCQPSSSRSLASGGP